MKSKILSLNIGGPAEMKWDDKVVVSSMHKRPTSNGLIVSKNEIAGDSFANPKAHGLEESVLYVFGLKSIQRYLDCLGREAKYEFGELGENITVDEFEESETRRYA